MRRRRPAARRRCDSDPRAPTNVTRGRKPKPTKLKVIQGNAGKRPPNEDEPEPDLSFPTCPPHLSDEAKIEWGRICEELYKLGLLTEIDRAALAAYCQAYGRWVHAEQQVAKSGPIIKTPVKEIEKRKRNGDVVIERSGGYPIKNPFLSVADKALEQMKAFLVEFGMTPSSRSRVKAAPRDDVDSFDEMFGDSA